MHDDRIVRRKEELMPSRPMKPCPEPTCWRLTNGGRCDEHDLRRRRAAEHPRGSSTQQGYGSAWRRLRLVILARDPVCRDDSGCDALSQDVDHIVARRHGGSDHPTNLRGMCHSHHSRKTVLRDGGWGRSRSSADAKRGAATHQRVRGRELGQGVGS